MGGFREGLSEKVPLNPETYVRRRSQVSKELREEDSRWRGHAEGPEKE